MGLTDNLQLLDRINRVKYWRHRIPIGRELITPGLNNKREVFQKLGLADLVQGKTVLDIGAWDGGLSFEAERLGAKKVLATDVWFGAPANRQWWDDIRNGDEGFLCAKEILESAVENKNMDVLEVSPQSIGIFDVIIFHAVLYHLQHPLLALKKLHSVCNEVLILESAILNDTENTPLMLFRGEGGWYPNFACLLKMLEVAGFSKIERIVPQKIQSQQTGIDDYPLCGICRKGTRMYRDIVNKKALLTLDTDEPVFVLNTELGNMNISNPKSRFLRVERWKYRLRQQCWIDKDNIEIHERSKTAELFAENIKRENTTRVALRAIP